MSGRRLFAGWIGVLGVVASTALMAAEPTKLGGRIWTEEASRDEVRPQFTTLPGTTLMLKADIRGADGWWQTEVPIEGGQTYQVTIQRHLEQVATPHRSAVVRIDWLDANNRRVPGARPFVKGILEGYNDMQQPDYLDEPRGEGSLARSAIGEEGFLARSTTGPEGSLARSTTGPEGSLARSTTGEGQWHAMGGTYLSPPTAVKARVELHLRWCAVGAIAQYRELSFEKVKPIEPRKVKLATIHLQPRGGNPQANREAFVDVITQAAAAGAQLVVLPETLPYYGTGMTPLESAESVPGPSTEFFGALAKKLNIHIVATCFEKSEHHLFNTAMLLGPDGQMIGRYRKVCIPRGEIEAGVEPGTEYPVFDTKLGRIGMMICYDGFFPQVAQRLTDAGAEVIAWPVWGCNPLLARARAAENQVAIVSSTYTEPDRDWMISAVYDPNGAIVAQATKWGSFAMAELDLSRPPYWPSLGTHRSERYHHQPE